MNEIRARFEEIWPVPDDVTWCDASGAYWFRVESHEPTRMAYEMNLRLDTFTRCQEMMAIPEITKEQVFFALCCQMEDPSDDEEDGFNAGVSWWLAFIKQEIAKRSKK